MKMIIFGLVASLMISACASNQKTEAPKSAVIVEPALPNLRGNWRSSEPEMIAKGLFSTREYRINQSRYEMVYSLASDKDMKKLLMVYRAEGPYTVEAPSVSVPGANLATFKASRRFLKLKSRDPKLVKVLGLEKCNLVPNQEIDVTEKGCGIVESVAECGQEFNLVKLDNEQLFLGERSLDKRLCTADERPTQLGPPLKKLY